jgi:hypothetical protein
LYDPVETHFDECGEEEEESAELGTEGSRLEVQGPNVSAIGQRGFGVGRPLVIATAWQFGKTFLAEDGGHGDRCAFDAFAFQSPTNVVNGLVLLAKFDDALPEDIGAPGCWFGWFDKEATVRLMAELVDELMQAADSITEACRDLGAGQAFDKIGS